MSNPTEKQLDEALKSALMNRPDFSRWFLGKTRFGSEDAHCVFCRADHPWSSVSISLPDEGTNERTTLRKECETDVLVVFETPDGRRLAVHIENKRVGGSFTPYQPELYQARKDQWKERERLGGYTEATTVLVAPTDFIAKNRDSVGHFDAHVSHEEIAAFVPEFGICHS